MTYVHLRRYGRKPSGAEVAAIEVLDDKSVLYRGCRWDLRTGEKGDPLPGFKHTADGRYLAYKESVLEIHGRGPKPVRVQASGSLASFVLVGDCLVLSDDRRQPWLVIDATTGQPLGRVTDQIADASYGTPLYSPNVFDPRDGRTLWLTEIERIAQLDVKQRKMTRVIALPPEQMVVVAAALPDGHVLALIRPRANKATFVRTGDKLVLYAPDNSIVRSIDGSVMFLAVLGDRFIASFDRESRFVIYDRTLELLERIDMFETGGNGFNQIVPLPSGREWIAIGGRGEWDHYGEPELVPRTLAQREAATKAAAKKPAPPKEAKGKKGAAAKDTKKTAKKPAAKTPAAAAKQSPEE